jgi:hypothetical protein
MTAERTASMAGAGAVARSSGGAPKPLTGTPAS